MRSAALIVAVLLAALAGSARGQSPPPPTEPAASFAVNATDRFDTAREHRSRRVAGAVAGFVVGAGATYLILNTGGSTSLCDRSANQDAIALRECLALAALGGVAGAVIGGIIGSRIRVAHRSGSLHERLHVGVTPWPVPSLGLRLTSR